MDSSLHIANLVIDIGTHAVRVSAVSLDNKILKVVSRDLALIYGGENEVEQDGEEIITKTEQAIAELCSGEFEFVRAGIAIQRSTTIAWDKHTGKAVSPALSWQDTRSSDAINELKDIESKVRSISGLVLSPHYGALKIQLLQERYYDRGDSVVVAPLVSFVLFRLVKGSPYICDESNAARTQLFDITQRDWSHELCEVFGVELKKLPRTQAVESDYGILKSCDIPVCLVCGDQNAAYYALKSYAHEINADPHETIYLNIGSGAFLLTDHANVDITPFFLSSLAHSDTDSIEYVLEGTVNGVGVLLGKICRAWCEQNGADEQTFYQEIDKWYDDPEHKKRDLPIFINTEGGLGSPFWKTNLQSSWINTEEEETLPLLLMAICVVESIAFLIAINIQEMKKLKPDLNVIICGGGGSRINALCQHICDITNMSLYVVSEPESTILGVAEKLSEDKNDDENIKGKYSATENESLNNRYKIFASFVECLVKAHGG